MAASFSAGGNGGGGGAGGRHRGGRRPAARVVRAAAMAPAARRVPRAVLRAPARGRGRGNGRDGTRRSAAGPRVRFADARRGGALLGSQGVGALSPAGPAAPVGERLTGKLSFIDNAIDTSTQTVQLKATFDNANGRLWAGQFAATSLHLFDEDNALVVPTQAVVSGQRGTYVYVVDQSDTARQRGGDRRAHAGRPLDHLERNPRRRSRRDRRPVATHAGRAGARARTRTTRPAAATGGRRRAWRRRGSAVAAAVAAHPAERADSTASKRGG